ncbi:hypothetical protein VCHA53O466_50269 [Vibrio chagasii]|nr:hypothetical protein VCHA53O466_50269 [Vibrio chagasii]
MDIENWDKGDSLFELLESNPFFEWDFRDSYSIKEVKAIIEKLVRLDPTKMVATAYMTLVITTTLNKTKIKLADAVLHPDFTDFIQTIRTEKENLDEYTKPIISAFTERLQKSCEQFSGSRFIFKEEYLKNNSDDEDAWIKARNYIKSDDVIKILRDAVVATETTVHWIYSNSSNLNISKSSIALQSDIYLYGNLVELEKDIHEHNLPYGIRYVTVNGTTDSSKSMNLIVFTSPTHAFFMGEISWDRYESKMKAKVVEGNSYSLNLDRTTTHFPELDSKNKITLTREGRQFIGSIKTSNDECKLWLLMLTEMIALKLPDMKPQGSLISTKLLLPASGGNTLPVLHQQPFSITHMTLEQALEGTGLNDSFMKDDILYLVKGIKIEHLLPIGDTVFDVDADEFIDAIPSKYHHRTGTVHQYIALRPYPELHFGNYESTVEAHNYVIQENITKIINRKLELLWARKEDEHDQFFSKLLKKKSKSIGEKLEHLAETQLPKSAGMSTFDEDFFSRIIRPCSARRLALKEPERYRHMGIPAGVPALYRENPYYKSDDDLLLGYFSMSTEYERYLLTPESSDDLTKIFSCRKTSLPKLYQNWVRQANHGSIRYPWNPNRSISCIGLFWIYK